MGTALATQLWEGDIGTITTAQVVDVYKGEKLASSETISKITESFDKLCVSGWKSDVMKELLWTIRFVMRVDFFHLHPNIDEDLKQPVYALLQVMNYARLLIMTLLTGKRDEDQGYLLFDKEMPGSLAGLLYMLRFEAMEHSKTKQAASLLKHYLQVVDIDLKLRAIEHQLINGNVMEMEEMIRHCGDAMSVEREIVTAQMVSADGHTQITASIKDDGLAAFVEHFNTIRHRRTFSRGYIRRTILESLDPWGIAKDDEYLLWEAHRSIHYCEDVLRQAHKSIQQAVYNWQAHNNKELEAMKSTINNKELSLKCLRKEINTTIDSMPSNDHTLLGRVQNLIRNNLQRRVESVLQKLKTLKVKQERERMCREREQRLAETKQLEAEAKRHEDALLAELDEEAKASPKVQAKTSQKKKSKKRKGKKGTQQQQAEVEAEQPSREDQEQVYVEPQQASSEEAATAYAPTEARSECSWQLVRPTRRQRNRGGFQQQAAEPGLQSSRRETAALRERPSEEATAPLVVVAASVWPAMADMQLEPTDEPVTHAPENTPPKTRTQPARDEQELPSQTKQKECAVCLDGPPEHACLPCGHKCLCEGCAEKFGPDKEERICPICREPLAYRPTRIFSI